MLDGTIPNPYDQYNIENNALSEINILLELQWLVGWNTMDDYHGLERKVDVDAVDESLSAQFSQRSFDNDVGGSIHIT